MTRRDFALIADSIRTAITNLYEGPSHRDALLGAHAVARTLASTLRATNPRFDDRRFLEACGVPTVE